LLLRKWDINEERMQSALDYATPKEIAAKGNSGVMTFQCNHQGKVFEKDLGPDGDLIAAAIDEYDPDGSWNLVEEQ